jgi:two-component system, NtrC family, response regulator AtoC
MTHAPKEDDRTDLPEPRAEPVTPSRLLVFWEGGFKTLTLDEERRITVGRASSCDVSVQHGSVSRLHAVFHVGPRGASISVEDVGSANGTRIKGQPLSKGVLTSVPPGAMVELGSVMALFQPAADAEGGPASARRGAVPGAMAEIHALVERIAPSHITVLLLGETGVGKGVVAEAIHQRSARADKPLLPLNCGALAESVLETELFGHEKGAFTGAVAQTPGLLESAHGGTVFLDEVGELPPATQVKLLRVLENREVMRVGGRRPIPVDVRFIAATNRDLDALVADGRFRKDLFFRLNGISIQVPPLRERVSEIAPLARAFAQRAAKELGGQAPELSTTVLSALAAYAWPGNVRELRNVVERAVVLAGGRPVGLEHVRLPERDAGSPSAPRPAPAQTPAEPGAPQHLRAELEDVERRRIVEALEQVAGNQSRAAELLGMSRRTLLRRLDDYGIPRPRKETE